MTTVVATESLGRSFGSIRALHDISLTIPQGQITALIGPNGAGKTTLLKLLMGHLVPAAGIARLWGDVAYPPSPSHAGRVACVLDRYEPPMGTLVGSILKLRQCASHGFDWSLAESLCREQGIDLNRFWHRLSKGQRRWVLTTAALASRAELYLLDEPADGLDPAARRRLFGLMRRQVEEYGATVLVASHILEDLERAADSVAVLVQGEIRLTIALEQMRDEIRAVEVGNGFDVSSIPSAIRVLAQRELPDSSLLWLWCHEGLFADEALEGEVQRWPVSLTDLYFALTEAGQHDRRTAEKHVSATP